MTDEACTRTVVSEGTVDGVNLPAGTVGAVGVSAPPTRRSRPGIPRQLPAAVSSELWTDRAPLMQELTTLAQQPGPLLVVLDGDPEVGTSALAAQWIHDHADWYADGQFFADLGQRPGPTPAVDVLSWWLPALGVEVPDALDARSAAWRSATAGGRFAILLDHATDETQVRPLLVSSAASVTLVTSRTPLLGLARQGAFHLQVDPLQAADATVLLQRLAGPRAHHLATACQGRPGRIRRLAAWLNVQPATAPIPVPPAWEVSTDMVYTVSSQHAQQLLRRIGDTVADFDVTTAEALTGTDRSTTAAVLDELVHAGVLAQRPGPAPGLPVRYAMKNEVHRRVAGYAMKDPAEVREQARKRVTASVLARLVEKAFVLDPESLRYNPAFAPYRDGTVTPTVDRHAALAWTIAELPAVLTLMHAADHAGDADTVCYFAESVWPGYLIAGYHDYFLRIHELAVTAIGRSHPMASILLTRLSWAYRKQRRWPDAIEAAEAAQNTAAAAGDLTAESAAISAVGRVHYERGHYAQARTSFRQSRILAAKAGDDRGVGLRARHIAACWTEQQQYLPAKELYEEALEAAHAQQDWLNWARAATKLATVLTELGTPRQAVDYLEHAERIMAESGSARYHADVLAARAQTDQALGLPSEARQHYAQAEQLYQRAGELDDADTMRTRRDHLTDDTD